MKELSIEEKAKRYDEAIERAKEINREHSKKGFKPSDDVLYIFPELKESEDESADEKVRKALIKLVTNHASMDLFIEYDIHLDEALSWLEKQGEQKPIKEHDVCEFCEERYGCVSPCSMKLIEEQKPAEEYNITGIGSKHATGKLAEKIKELNEKSKELKLLKQDEQKPFGQRDECLHCQFNYAGECKGFCAMKRSNRKPHKPTDKIESRQEKLTEFEKAVKQVMEEAIECGDTHNLKADADLLLRIARKTSWSEEDEDNVNKILCICDDFAKSFEISPASTKVIKEDVDKIDNWLKSLKERYTWRPSDEQMGVLLSEVTAWTKGCPKQIVWESLYNDLLKLKE